MLRHFCNRKYFEKTFASHALSALNAIYNFSLNEKQLKKNM